MLPADVPEEIYQRLAVEGVIFGCEVTFLTIGALTDDERRRVPEVWLQALQESGRAGVQLMLDHWDSVLPRPLPEFTQRLREACVDVILGRQFGEPVLIYVLEGSFGGDRYAPLVANLPRPIVAMPRHCQGLSEDFLAFHTGLHDGLASDLCGGVLPFERMESVGDYYEPDRPFEMYKCPQWGPETKALPPATKQPDWNQIVLVAWDGGSGRLCAVLDADGADIDGWYWFEGSMSPEADIWQTFDIWLADGAADWSSKD